MPYLFKLARRLACIHKLALLSSMVAIAACADFISPVSPPVELLISPEAVSLTPGQSLQFASFGRTELGDSVPVAVAWSASRGRITKDGLLTADTIPGDYEVTATTNRPHFVRAAQVQVVPAPHAVFDLAAMATSDRSATLSFTEVDDGTGQPASYEVRYATAPIEWGSARAVGEGTCAAPLVGAAIGASRSCTVLGLSAATEHGFQLVALRQLVGTAPVLGRPSNVATSTTADSADYWSVASVQVQPMAMGGDVGFGGLLSATLKDANGKILNGRTVVWSSTNGAIATVSDSGWVTTLGAGTATIIATSESSSGSAAITVRTPGVTAAPVASVAVSPASASILVGATRQLSAVIKDAAGNTLTDRAVTWSSSAPAIASVLPALTVVSAVASADDGNIPQNTLDDDLATRWSADGDGQWIQYDLGALAAIDRVGLAWYLGDIRIAYFHIDVSPDAVTWTKVFSGQSSGQTLQPEGYDFPTASGRYVRIVGHGNSLNGWNSITDAKLYSSASSTGRVAGLAAGVATITATSEGRSGTAKVTVANAPVAAVTVVPASASILVGATVQLSAVTTDSAGNVLSGRAVTWTTSNGTLAPVSATGLVTGLVIGTATITATSEGKTGSAAISVGTSTGKHYYVAPTGSDANPCSTASPCYTMKRVSQLLAPGDWAHFASGNYSWGSPQRVSVSGTASARVTYISDVQWGAKISGSCEIMHNYGDYVDIVGFDMTGTCASGLQQDGNYGRIIGNRVHDLPGTNGYAGIHVDCCDYSLTGNEIIGNVVDNVGPWGGTNTIHGIYVSGPNSVIMNNIVTRASAACIEMYHGPTRMIVANNVVANCGRYGIEISGDAAIRINDYTTVSNNIVVNGGGRGIYESSGGATGTRNVYYNNIVYNNPSGNLILNTGTQSGTLTLTSAQFSALFVNYTGDMYGDYRLRSGAVAIDAGTTSCAAGVSLCVPLTDFLGVSRPKGAAYDIGAYEY